jgi:hypothetical protein
MEHHDGGRLPPCAASSPSAPPRRPRQSSQVPNRALQSGQPAPPSRGNPRLLYQIWSLNPGFRDPK